MYGDKNKLNKFLAVSCTEKQPKTTNQNSNLCDTVFKNAFFDFFFTFDFLGCVQFKAKRKQESHLTSEKLRKQDFHDRI